ncbi:TlpA disulfide reductase family protein [Shewanella sp. MBTL60-007]|uniref:TlpA disulfide reductase family protein n=1 Tax=Shewanella sp. MBTL60-007 TaxID=2815911 RepID=UPI001BBE0EF6|nr:TlpA disulfide reductase family protein [Shewanella sp. MBTL60-007]GIU27216.1 alkyl hydroperoxide reductase [Shewanella sp. MBTL60-007]
MRLTIVGLVAATMLVAAGAQAYPGMEKQAERQVQSSVDLISVLPKPFPIEAVPFKDSKGEAVDFSQYKGKVIMVNMWATWCPPCVRELPAISRFSAKIGSDDFEVLPVSIDLEGNKQVEPFLKSLGMEDFNTYYDKEQKLGHVFPLDTIPATFILNREGELIAFVRTFVDWDDDKAVTLIKSFLEQPQQQSKVTSKAD